MRVTRCIRTLAGLAEFGQGAPQGITNARQPGWAPGRLPRHALPRGDLLGRAELFLRGSGDFLLYQSGSAIRRE